MNKLFIVLLIIYVNADAYEDCLKANCPTLYNQCYNDVFGCQGPYNKCQKKCTSGDGACLQQCGNESGSKTLISLYQCGNSNCLTCHGCEQRISTQCVNMSLECKIKFFEQNKDCMCLL
ncbi:hypothetical protein pb186bvf_010102 [Paramecium bursaria]